MADKKLDCILECVLFAAGEAVKTDKLAEIVDETQGTNIAEQIAAGITGQPAPTAPAEGQGAMTTGEALGGGEEEAPITKKARERVANSTNPT